MFSIHDHNTMSRGEVAGHGPKNYIILMIKKKALKALLFVFYNQQPLPCTFLTLEHSQQFVRIYLYSSLWLISNPLYTVVSCYKKTVCCLFYIKSFCQ